ncbi:DGQHR domain [Citrobacter braakii]|uniref:DNA sulfur modification protein DndB n=1 Tax=Citrobacter braakii TaxID=57706 RepID=UPI001C22E806|nr:DNA sulfur modification protein DndB [Citrobacter braakii]QXA92606.1 hypothetical protein I6L52_20500 [Citrobacter braakii]STB41319.1 DGQHR domain [Citrobacter braakii]
MSDAFGIFGQEDIYSFKKTGSFGRFSTIESFPIEFFLTSLKASELHHLTFARDIKPGKKIDFDQLLQRDLDIVRVETEIKPYITNADSKSRTIFFPPLLVAAVPVSKNTMEEFYSKQQITKTSSGNRNFYVRMWDGLFKLTLMEDGNYSILPSLEEPDSYISVAREPSQIEIKLSNNIERGIKLIVIDGQHRLKALQEVYDEDSKDVLKEMTVPLCILFSPNSTKEVSDNLEKNGITIPRVPEIFRQLFVDVNKNAEQVGGHFNILLSEGNMGSLACRLFCAHVLNTQGIEGLAQIEWNQKKKKLSTEINRAYYITSIGVIEKALSETFGKFKTINDYFINFEDIREAVQPPLDDDHLDYPKVSWDKFSLSQKKHIVKQIQQHVVPLLERLFFKSKLYAPATDCFHNEIAKLKNKSDHDVHGGIVYRPVLESLLEYMPIPETDKYREARHNLRVFEEDIRDCKSKNCFSMLNHAIFQRALFMTWSEILKIGNRASINKDFANQYFFSLIDEFASYPSDVIDFKKGYCQSFIFNGTRVNPTNEVKNGISYLILSLLSNKNTRNRLVNLIDIKPEDRALSVFKEEIRNTAYASLNNYMSLYKKYRVKVFKSNYPIDSTIDLNLRRELQEEENKKKRELKEFKDGVISKDKLTNRFDEMVNECIKIDILKAQEELRISLGLELDVFGVKDISSDTSDDIIEDESIDE